MRILASSFALALLLCAAPAARADWLVLTSGLRIETHGAWEVRGRQVRFTTEKTRQLQSLPVSEVDLEASRGANGPDPNRPRAEAVAEGGVVTLGVDPDFRGAKLDPAPLPRSIRDLKNLKLNPKAIEGDKSLFGPGGTLSSGVSIVAQLYDASDYLRSLRQKAVAKVGETGVSEVEAVFNSVGPEIHRACVDAGVDVDSGADFYCYAYVLATALEILVGGDTTGYNPEVEKPLESGPTETTPARDAAESPRAESEPPSR